MFGFDQRPDYWSGDVSTSSRAAVKAMLMEESLSICGNERKVPFYGFLHAKLCGRRHLYDGAITGMLLCGERICLGRSLCSLEGVMVAQSTDVRTRLVVFFFSSLHGSLKPPSFLAKKKSKDYEKFLVKLHCEEVL